MAVLSKPHDVPASCYLNDNVLFYSTHNRSLEISYLLKTYKRGKSTHDDDRWLVINAKIKIIPFKKNKEALAKLKKVLSIPLQGSLNISFVCRHWQCALSILRVTECCTFALV